MTKCFSKRCAEAHPLIALVQPGLVFGAVVLGTLLLDLCGGVNQVLLLAQS